MSADLVLGSFPKTEYNSIERGTGCTMADALLQKKGVPPAKALAAAVCATLIVCTIAYRLYSLSVTMEEHFHIFHPLAQHPELKKALRGEGTVELVTSVVQFPLLTMLGLVLVIPLGPYITEHEAFQSLNPLLPHHYATLCYRVYSAWSRASNGKLAGKDL